MDQNSQARNNISDESTQQEPNREKEGYYSMFHRIQEMLYGPGSPLSSKDKVFNYLNHWELRWPEGHPLAEPKTKVQIAQATGLTHSQIEKSVRVLQKSKWVETIERKIGGVHQPTRYRVNQKTFGPIRVPKKESLTLIQGGYPKKDLPPSKESSTLQPNQLDKTTLNYGYHSGIQTLNNSIKQKDSNNNNKGEVVVKKGMSWEQVKSKILERYPFDGHRLERAYQQISQDKSFPTCKDPIYSPARFILGGWEYIRDHFGFADEVESRRSKSPPRVEEEFDYEASDKSRNEVMDRWKRNLR